MKQKQKIAFILLSVVLLAYSGDCHAQFLDKLAKSLEKTVKQVDKILGTVELSGSDSKMSYSTPHKNIQMNWVGATMSGDYYVLEFTITNKGEDIGSYRLGGYEAYDNLGNKCRIDIIFAGTESKHSGNASGRLLNNTPSKVKVLLSRFSSKATSFTQVRLVGKAWDSGYIDKPNGYFIFKNVPIVREQEQEVNTSIEKDIPETKFGMNYWSQAEQDKYSKSKGITQQERLALKINNIQDHMLNKELKNNELVKGKTIYEDESGSIKSVIVVSKYPGESPEFFEYLISYDFNGNYINHLQVGEKRTFYTNDIYAIVKGETITVTNYYAEGDDEETIVTKYKISPELKFVQMK
ncbi:hypothetical protein M2132_000027 [Dysgonomonas sp. PH5-45]|uniref:hypothetical protein n=1 Tax=unclassified Dysgonomonas TaxID=2630389 RepID=UPI0024763342|nr:MULTISPECIES: hypothetical protein [unclassified Dysgonomonas]MDH6353710.1 hypothetical protein [Dysgonomonas sp. PH5-45]MDH6386613.1 hypothetical protein [Dysgonomonas sp. PH5-37]